MNTRTRKPLIWTGFILLCLSVLGSFLTSSPVLAQEMIRKSGEVAGGDSDFIPIRLKVGELVQGEIIADEEPLRVSIAGPSGEIIRDFGRGKRGGFYYAAEIDGTHYIVVTHPDEFSAGTRGYTINYAILISGLTPGTGSGKGVGKDGANPFMSDLLWIVAIIVLIVIFLFVRKSRRGGSGRNRRIL